MNRQEVLEGSRFDLEVGLPDWAAWTSSPPYAIGVEEEVMLLDPADWTLARRPVAPLSGLGPDLAGHVNVETHEAVLELTTSPHLHAAEAAADLSRLRQALSVQLAREGLAAAVAGTHPFAQWTDTRITRSPRYQLVYESMGELARREPTFALHVHVGVPDPVDAMKLLNRMRAHLPLLLALSANSPFWQGRDTRLASMRTPIFQAFPRVGIPRAFRSYGEYVETVEQLIRCGAFPDPSFLWWDVRLQPRFGTVEVRIMDAQTELGATGGLAALVQAIAHLELEEGYVPRQLTEAHELLAENRFLAARDGMDAELLDPVLGCAVPARRQLERLLDATREHARELGGEPMLAAVAALGRETGAARQRRLAGSGLVELVARLAADFA